MIHSRNVKLLSFGDDEGAVEEAEPVALKKTIVRPDMIDNPEKSIPDILVPLSMPSQSDKQPSSSLKELKSEKSSKKDDNLDITKIRERHAQEKASESNSRKAEIDKIEADLRKLSRRRDGDDSDDEHSKKKVKKSYLEEELAKYSKGKSKKGKKKDEGDILAALNSFRGKLKSSMFGNAGAENDDNKVGGDAGEEKVRLAVGEEDPGIEVDDDRGFLSHVLHFAKDDGEESRKAERDYEVIDPRERGAKAREEERQRKRAMKAKVGGARHRR